MSVRKSIIDFNDFRIKKAGIEMSIPAIRVGLRTGYGRTTILFAAETWLFSTRTR